MSLRDFLSGGRRAATVGQILSTQILWMLLLRVILYTLLLALNYFFQSPNLDLIPMPPTLMALLLLVVYFSTIGSAILLLVTGVDARRFGFGQILLDTIFATVLIYCTGVSQSPYTSIYFFPIIAGGLILLRKGGLVSASAATLLYGTILTLELFGYFPPYLQKLGYQAVTDHMVSLNHFSVQGLTFFLAAILSGLFSLRIKSTEEALSDSLRNYDRLAILYKQIFDNIATGIITIDGHGVITSANNAAEEITDYPADALPGKVFAELFPKLNLAAPRMRQAADFDRPDGKTIRIGYSHVNLDTAGTSRHEKGQDKIITLRDISEIEQLEQQMRQAEKLAAIGMMSASIAHDFRNPLTAISGSAQVLANEFSKNGSASLVNYELADIILRESNRMIVTISDFLKFSRPETADREWFSLRRCLDEVIQVCKASPSWPLSAVIRTEVDEQLDIWADQKQIYTLLSHLVHNGIAFCPPGDELIEISARESRGADQHDTLLISVTDNGPGVAEEHLDKIFEPFFTSRADGTGLGLAIVNQIVEEHGGHISVERPPNRGARFNVALPLPS